MKASDFKVGDRVIHANQRSGTVEEIKSDGTVCVAFNDVDSKGKWFRGQYDVDWFRIHPDLLKLA